VDVPRTSQCFEVYTTHTTTIHHVSRQGKATVIPTAYILVEGKGAFKHLFHDRHLGRVPTPDVLVEDLCLIKHIQHVGGIARVPASNVVVERGCV